MDLQFKLKFIFFAIINNDIILFTMEELLSQTGAILREMTELLKIPAIAGAVTELFGWLKSKFTGKSAQEKLTLIEQNKHKEATIIGLQGNIESVLENNEVLKEQLADKLNQIDRLMKHEGVKIFTKINTLNSTGNGNINFQDIKLNGGNISVNRKAVAED